MNNLFFFSAESDTTLSSPLSHPAPELHSSPLSHPAPELPAAIQLHTYRRGRVRLSGEEKILNKCR